MNWLDEKQEIPHSDEWAELEAEYERFMGQHSEHDVLMKMTDAEYEAWKKEYRRLYVALWKAQIAYYDAIRGE